MALKSSDPLLLEQCVRTPRTFHDAGSMFPFSGCPGLAVSFVNATPSRAEKPLDSISVVCVKRLTNALVLTKRFRL